MKRGSNISDQNPNKSKQWEHPGSFPRKEAKTVPSDGNVIGLVFRAADGNGNTLAHPHQRRQRLFSLVGMLWPWFLGG